MKPRSLFLVAVAVASLLFVVACSSPAAQPVATTAPAKPATTTAPAKPAATTTVAAPATTAPPAASKPADFPQKGKTITLLVPFAAGGPSDLMARLIAPELEKELGVPVVVTNKAGAGSQVGITELAKSKPDGYMIATANFPFVPIMYTDKERHATFGRKDLMPLAVTARDPNVIAVQSSSPFKSLKDLVDAAKAKPNTVLMGTVGLQTGPHLAGVRLEKLAGVKFRYVHFEGGGPAATGLLGGHSEALVATGNSSIASGVKSGTMRVLGLMGEKEHPAFPGGKTLIEQGYKMTDYNTMSWLLPAGVPDNVVGVLSSAFKKVADSAEYQSKMTASGTTPYFMGPKELKDYWDEVEPEIGPFLEYIKQD